MTVRHLRILMAFCAIICNLTVATVALTPIHGHPQRHCDICVTAHLPLLPELCPVAVPTPSARIWLAVQRSESRVTEFSAGPSDPRGPPFQS